MPCLQRDNTHQRGFTVVEVLLVSPIILLTIAVFVGVLIFITGEVLMTRSQNSLTHNTRDALRMIERDVKMSNGFLATNSVSPIVSPQGRGNDAQAFANASFAGQALILYMPATTGGPQQSARIPVWLRDQPSACTNTAYVDRNRILMYDVVYFVADNTLWRRTIMPANYRTSGCRVPDERPSCHPDRPTNTTCVARDVRLLDNVTSFNLRYFTSASSTTSLGNAANRLLTNPVRQGHLSTTNTVSVNLSAATTVAGRDISYSSSLRASRAGSLFEASAP